MAFLRTTLCAAIMVTVVMSKPVSDGEDSSKSSESSESNSSEENATHVGASQEPLQPAFTETDPLGTAATLPSADEGLSPATLPSADEGLSPATLPSADEGPSPATLPSADEGLSPATLPSADEGLSPATLPSADEGFLQPRSLCRRGPSPATLDTSALPDPEDPQTSTDALQLMPDDPSQTAAGMDVSQDMPDADPSQDSFSSDAVHLLPASEGSLHPGLTETCTSQPQVATATTASQRSPRSPQGVTPPFPLHIITPTPLQFSTASPLPIAMGTAQTGIPVCFTFQFTTPEPDPPRGDSM